jgi:hypothetical protein
MRPMVELAVGRIVFSITGGTPTFTKGLRPFYPAQGLVTLENPFVI